MEPRERIIRLEEKLESMRREAVAEWERPIYEVALRAVEDKIVELSRLVRNRSYFMASPPEFTNDDLNAA